MERRLTISVEGKESFIFEDIIKQAYGYWANLARRNRQRTPDGTDQEGYEEREELCRRILEGECFT